MNDALTVLTFVTASTIGFGAVIAWRRDELTYRDLYLWLTGRVSIGEVHLREDEYQ
jgi:hypothetical protein